MASRLATVSKDKILAVNEAAVPTNTKKETKFGLSVFTGGWKKIFLTDFATIHKKWSPKHCQLKRKQTLLNNVFNFYPTDLVNTKTTISLRVGS